MSGKKRATVHTIVLMSFIVKEKKLISSIIRVTSSNMHRTEHRILKLTPIINEELWAALRSSL